MRKWRNFQNNINETQLSELEEFIEIFGILESKGFYFQGFMNKNITYDDIIEIFNTLNTKLLTRFRIQSARDVFNRLNGEYFIKGDRSGTKFIKNKKSKILLKEDKIYQTFLNIYIALLNKKGIIEVDILYHIKLKEYPIAFLMYLAHCIKNKENISFTYYSHRKKESHKILSFLPVKIIYREKMWYLVGWDYFHKSWKFYPFHGITSFHKCRVHNNKNFPKGNPLDLFKYSFDPAIYGEKNPIKFIIQVPKNERDSVEKNRSNGEWHEKTDCFHWHVDAYEEEEIFEYIFKWGGLLKIIFPTDSKKAFVRKLESFLEQYKN